MDEDSQKSLQDYSNKEVKADIKLLKAELKQRRNYKKQQPERLRHMAEIIQRDFQGRVKELETESDELRNGLRALVVMCRALRATAAETVPDVWKKQWLKTRPDGDEKAKAPIPCAQCGAPGLVIKWHDDGSMECQCKNDHTWTV